MAHVAYRMKRNEVWLSLSMYCFFVRSMPSAQTAPIGYTSHQGSPKMIERVESLQRAGEYKDTTLTCLSKTAGRAIFPNTFVSPGIAPKQTVC
jgi:hypothetical protein